MLDNLALLTRFQAIVEAGSLRSAARALGVSQPALSRSLAQLEKHFGQPLLERQARGVIPTGFGRQVLSVASRMAREWEVAESQLRLDGKDMQGVLRIQAGPLWQAVLLPRLVVEMQTAFPKLSIEVMGNRAGHALEDLLEGRCDIVFGGLFVPDLAELGLKRQVFGRIRDCVVARKDHPVMADKGRDGRISADALIRFPWLVYAPDPLYREETLRSIVARTGQTPDLRLSSDSLIHVLRVLQSSDFLAMLPDAAVAETTGPAIVPVDLHGRDIDTGAIYRSAMADWPPIEKLLAFGEKHFSSANGEGKGGEAMSRPDYRHVAAHPAAALGRHAQ